MESSNPQLSITTSVEKAEPHTTLSPFSSPSSSSDGASPHYESPTVVFSSSPNLSPVTLQAPTRQEMDRSAYRAPSSVFEFDRSKNWSTLSNESLFSISGGNLSFTNDMLTFKSGELFTIPDTASDHMFSYSALDQPGSANSAAMMRDQELGLAEATMKEVIEESEAGQNFTTPRKDDQVPRTHHRSQESNASIMSFAFSAKLGESDKAEASKAPSLVRLSQEQGQPKSRQFGKPKAKEEAGKAAESKAPQENAPRFVWFPRFCPCCHCLR